MISMGLEALLLFALYFVFPDAYQFSVTLVALPLLVLLIFLQVAGIGLMTSGLNVHFRDVQYIVSSMLVVGFWVSPLLYSSSMAPPALMPILHINPLTGVMDGARDIVLNGRWPDPVYLIPSAVWAVVLFLAGCAVFRRLNLTTSDYI
jgi:ABC-type polysaccharide/polyol phosphate export permease